MTRTLHLLIAMNLALAAALAGAVALLMAQSANAAGGVKLSYQKIETYTDQMVGCPKGYYQDKDRDTIEYLVPRDTFPFPSYPVVSGVSTTSKYSSSLGGNVVTSVTPQSVQWGTFRLKPCYTYAVSGVSLK